VEDPPDVKFQLNRVIFAQPYFNTLKFDGFISCSGNYVFVLSEECGEGVGSPNTTCDEGLPPPCVANPVMPGQRIGHQGNNNIQFNFYVDNLNIKSMVIEQVWEPTSDAGKALYTPVSTNWACDPICDGNQITSMDGESPLYSQVAEKTLSAMNLTTNTTISTFTWASPSTTGVTLNQKFELFVSNFYYLAPPDGWSFVKGDAPPF
jgi:hypothetical protein